MSMQSMVAGMEYMGMSSSFEGTPPLSASVGYGVVLGFGLFFTLFASFTTFLNERYNGVALSSEEFNSK
jgi:hypothetical protein